MKTLLLASAVLGLATTPALAQKGKSHGNHGAKAMHSTGSQKAMKSQRGKSQLASRYDANRNGILDRRERGFIDRNRDGRDDRFVNRDANRYGVNDCPPGLARKNNGCLPPGQAKRLFSEGQRLPAGYNSYTNYNDIPLDYRNRYGLSDANRYVYRDDSIYVVDPRTSIVQRIIQGLIR